MSCAPGACRVPKRDADGNVIGWLKQEVAGQDPNEYVNGVAHVADPHRVATLKKALLELDNKLGRPATLDEVLRVGEQLGHDVRRSTFGELMEPHRPDNPIMAAVFDAVHAMVKDMPAHVVSPDMLQVIMSQRTRGLSPEAGRGPLPARHPGRSHGVSRGTARRHGAGAARFAAARTPGADAAEQHREALQAQPGGAGDSRPTSWRSTANGKRVTTHEFISELFTRPEVQRMLVSRSTCARASWLSFGQLATTSTRARPCWARCGTASSRRSASSRIVPVR